MVSVFVGGSEYERVAPAPSESRTFGAYLRDARQSLGLEVEGAAAKLGIEPAWLLRLERDEDLGELPFSVAIRLAYEYYLPFEILAVAYWNVSKDNRVVYSADFIDVAHDIANEGVVMVEDDLRTIDDGDEDAVE